MQALPAPPCPGDPVTFTEKPFHENLPKNYALCLASLVTLCGTAHAVGTITGLTAVPANPVAGESVKYKVTTSGSSACGARLCMPAAATSLRTTRWSTTSRRAAA